MLFQRPQSQLVMSRLKEPRRFIQVLFGPRQIGKTTLIRQVLQALNKPYIFLSADLVTEGHVWLEQQWEAARIRLAQERLTEVILVIDEVQKITNWSEAVKRFWDQDTGENRPIKVVLLGSSRLLLQQGLTESLTGRFETIYMGHWSYAEMRQAFGLSQDEYVWFGGYPGAVSLRNDEERWKRYINDSLIETSISRDILMLTRVDKPALMKRLFEIGCAYSGQIISLTKIMGQLQDAGNTVTLAHYLSLLDTAGLLSGLNKFAGKQHRQRASSPKFQVYNTALLTAQQLDFFETVRKDTMRWGRWVENAIGAYLINESIHHHFRVYYWRERNDEVDFILVKGNQIIALEVKTGKEKKSTGLSSFVKQWSPNKTLLIGDDGLNWQEFLSYRIDELFQ